MLNEVILMGRLTRDPELRRTSSGKAVTSLTLAVERDYAPSGGEREVDFIDCVAWGNLGEFIAKHFAKGQMAAVHGRLQIRNWTDNNGNKRRSAEVLVNSIYFCGAKQHAEQQETFVPASSDDYESLYPDYDPDMPY